MFVWLSIEIALELAYIDRRMKKLQIFVCCAIEGWDYGVGEETGEESIEVRVWLLENWGLGLYSKNWNYPEIFNWFLTAKRISLGLPTCIPVHTSDQLHMKQFEIKATVCSNWKMHHYSSIMELVYTLCDAKSFISKNIYGNRS